MNDKTGGNRGLRWAGALAVAAGVTVLAAACGGSAPSASSSASRQPSFAQEVSLAQCMRSHGAPNFPDPSAPGGFSLSISEIDSSPVQTAYADCRHLLPGGPSISQLEQDAQQAQQQQQKDLPALLKFSQCMRSHGLPSFPDPSLSGQLDPASLQAAGINPSSPQFHAAVSTCQRELPAGAQISVSAQRS
jgi:hypothetical protein